jgi:putative transposase
MPARNVVKQYAEDAYYHVYNRGVSKRDIFLDDNDYSVFLGLLKRYLDPTETTRKQNRVQYKSFADDVSLLAYCLMPNHFHLLLHQNSRTGMPEFLKSVSVSYSMYFNKKYKHTGALFQQRYRAVRMTDDSQFAHISRYIHMNPKDYEHWNWSSIGYYLGDKHAAWLKTDMLPDVGDYRHFLDEYKDRREELKLLKEDLAG